MVLIAIRWPHTWFQFFLEPWGNFFHLFTSNTQALQMSPTRSSDSLNKQHTRLNTTDADTQTYARFKRLPEAEPEGLLISAAVCEAWAGRLGLADAAAVVTPVNLWLVKAKHRPSVGRCPGENLKTCKQRSVIAPVPHWTSADTRAFYWRGGGGPWKYTRTNKSNAIKTVHVNGSRTKRVFCVTV